MQWQGRQVSVAGIIVGLHGGWFAREGHLHLQGQSYELAWIKRLVEAVQTELKAKISKRVGSAVTEAILRDHGACTAIHNHGNTDNDRTFRL